MLTLYKQERFGKDFVAMASTRLAKRHTRDAHADDRITSDGAHSAHLAQGLPPPAHCHTADTKLPEDTV